MVHEWLEAVVRIGSLLYRKRHANALVLAVKHLFAVMHERLPTTAYDVDLDGYRYGRLYTAVVEDVFLRVHNELKAVYDCYNMYHMGSKERRGMHFGPARAVFGIDIWNQMLNDALFGAFESKSKVPHTLRMYRLASTTVVILVHFQSGKITSSSSSGLDFCALMSMIVPRLDSYPSLISLSFLLDVPMPMQRGLFAVTFITNTPSQIPLLFFSIFCSLVLRRTVLESSSLSLREIRAMARLLQISLTIFPRTIGRSPILQLMRQTRR